MISVHCQGKLFNITVIQVYAPTSNAEEAEGEWFYEDLQDLLELTPKKDVLFILRDWNAEVGSQETPGVTGKFALGMRNEAGQRLIEFCQENALLIANTLFQQHKMSTHGNHQTVNIKIRLIIFFAAKDGEAQQKQSAKTRPGADCGSDHELLITKFRLKLKKVGKTMEELYKKDLHEQGNHDDVITNLEPDILECEVKWALEGITATKLVVVMEFQLSCFKS